MSAKLHYQLSSQKRSIDPIDSADRDSLLSDKKSMQLGFTLLELLIAMTIFAMLAVAGWQVFDGLNRAKERAEYHADQLSELQYAYLQIQQDMSQIVPYQDVPTQGAKPMTPDLDAQADAAQGDSQSVDSASSSATNSSPPLFSLAPTQISFVRFADPDPRYQTSPTLVRVEYHFEDEKLIRKQFATIDKSEQAVSLDSVLVEAVKAGQWQAYTPEVSTRFPLDSDAQSRALPAAANLQNNANDDPSRLLPKGIGLSFTYYDMPLSWRFALSAPSPNSETAAPNPSPSP